MTARLWIGGPIRRRDVKRFVTAIRAAKVSRGSPGFEHVICRPESIEGLLQAPQKDGTLHYQHDRTVASIVEVCRAIGLTYRLWTSDEEGVTTVERWAPGMDAPARFHGHPTDPSLDLVDAAVVRRAIKLLRRGKTGLARHTLEQSCPDLPAIPPFELAPDRSTAKTMRRER